MRSPSFVHFVSAPLAAALVLGCADTSPLQPDASNPANTGPSLAASSNAARVFREPLSFTLTPAECPSLSTTVTGTGVSRGAIVFFTSGNGKHVIFGFHNIVQGTATGADGSTYRFSYVHNERSTTEPLPPFEDFVVDRFSLLGQGGTRDIRVQQRLEFRVNPDNSVTLIKADIRGDPVECDPI